MSTHYPPSPPGATDVDARVHPRPAGASHSPAAPASGMLALIRLVNTLLRHARLVISVALLFGISAFVYASTRPLLWTSTAGFLLQAPKLGGSVPGLAAQLGVSLPTADPGHSPAFYSEMVKSRGILGALVDTVIRTDRGAVRLADAYDIEAPSPGLRRDKAIRRLDRAISVRSSVKSGVITFSVEAPSPELSPAIAMALVDELTRFNNQRRQSAARAERQLAERRLGELTEELRAAEGRLQAFLMSNRSFNGSPQLRAENARLEADVELRRAMHTSVSQSYEQAKIEEVRDTPQLTLVQVPEVPVLPNGRGRIGKTLAAMVFGTLLALLVAFGLDRLRATSRVDDEDVAEFTRLRESIIGRFRRPAPR